MRSEGARKQFLQQAAPWLGLEIGASVAFGVLCGLITLLPIDNKGPAVLGVWAVIGIPAFGVMIAKFAAIGRQADLDHPRDKHQ